MSCGVVDNSADVEALFPAGFTPEMRLNKISAIFSTGLSPRVITGTLRQIFCQHFSDPEHVLSPALRRYLTREGGWRSAEDSPLMIEAIANWRPEMTEARPGIVIKEGDWNWQRVVIGDGAGEHYQDGVSYFLGHWMCTHTVFALGGEGAETQNLASEVAKLILWYTPIIQDQLDLHRFTLVSLGALHVLEESKEHYVVPVTVAYVVEERWHMQAETPRLKRIRFNAAELMY